MGALCLTILAIAAPLEVQTRALPRAGRESLSLPFVAGEGAAAERINIVIYMTLLSIAPPAVEAALTEEGDAKWYKTLAFEVARNDERVLELSVDGETCATTCEPVRHTLTFDVRTGRSIDLTDVFTPAGLTAISTRMKAERVRRYSDQVRRLAHAKNDRFSEAGNKLTFHEGCLKLEQKHETRIASLVAAFAVKSVKVTAESCSGEATRVYDNVGEVSLTFAYGDAKMPMTTYGKSLILGGNDVAPPPAPFGQALRGTIGTAAVTVVLQRPSLNGTLNGNYFYDKRRKTIPLHGRLEKDGTIQLVESANTRFTLALDGATLSGKGLQDGRAAEVRLEAK